MLIVAVELPHVDVPVTVYVPVEARVAVNGVLSVTGTGPLHVYEVAPPPLSVNNEFTFTVVEGEAVAVTIGAELTITSMVAVAEHPALVPVTV